MYDIIDRTSAILGQISGAKTVKSEKVEKILYKPCDFKSGSEMPDISDMVPAKVAEYIKANRLYGG